MVDYWIPCHLPGPEVGEIQALHSLEPALLYSVWRKVHPRHLHDKSKILVCHYIPNPVKLNSLPKLLLPINTYITPFMLKRMYIMT